MRILLILLILFIVPHKIIASDINLLYQSVCKLQTVYIKDGARVSAGRYSGTVIGEDGKQFLILTCGHGPSPAPFGSDTYVWFHFNQAKESPILIGKVIWYKFDREDRQNDLGLVILLKSQFVSSGKRKYPFPKVVNIGSRSPSEGEQVVTLGYPAEHMFPTAYSLYIRPMQKDLITFAPAPKKGRSGSGIFNNKNELVSVLVTQNKRSGYGGGIPQGRIVQNLLTQLNKTK